jgi:CHU_C Type IX secretion signal domain
LSIKLEKSALLNLGDSLLLGASPSFSLKTVKWTPPEGLACDTCLTTFATPLLSTVYKLQITDIEGCKTTESISIVVEKKQRIFAPNLFSPNGDGKNEVFTIFTDASVARVKTLKIFNR